MVYFLFIKTTISFQTVSSCLKQHLLPLNKRFNKNTKHYSSVVNKYRSVNTIINISRCFPDTHFQNCSDVFCISILLRSLKLDTVKLLWFDLWFLWLIIYYDITLAKSYNSLSRTTAFTKFSEKLFANTPLDACFWNKQTLVVHWTPCFCLLALSTASFSCSIPTPDIQLLNRYFWFCKSAYYGKPLRSVQQFPRY